MRLTIQHGDVIYEPPIEEGVQIEWERSGTPGKLTFTTIKVDGLAFQEGDRVCFYYDNKLVFVGYVFKKTRDKEHHIKVTCYDQIRYLKNKYTYVFEKKTATQIVKSLCGDFGLKIGELDNTSYVIPAIAEENKAALDIVLDVLEETLLNTGKMFVLYDDCGNIRIRDTANMMSTTLLYEESAENFDYSSSIDDETYNSIVLYYDPSSNKSTSSSSGSGGSSSGSSGSEADKIVAMARSQIGTKENPRGSNKVKYNTAYYGSAVSGNAYPWCCAFVWWVFRECGLSKLFYGGDKTAYCPTAVSWFKKKGQWVTKNYKPGDVIFFDYEGNGNADHIGIVESVNGKKVTCIEGNYSDSVARVVRTNYIMGAGRPAYSSTKMADASSGGTASTNTSSKSSGIKIFTASSKPKIKEWGLLRYFEKVDTPSNGQNKANALLKLYNKKTRELKVTGAFGDITVRGGTLIPVKLNLGDVQTNNFMLVEKVTHKFDKDHHTMDLTLEGGWE
jgi:cell wall-associated NlpC family hydrolase